MKIKYLCQNTEELIFGDEVICLKFFTKQNTWRTERMQDFAIYVEGIQ